MADCFLLVDALIGEPRNDWAAFARPHWAEDTRGRPATRAPKRPLVDLGDEAADRFRNHPTAAGVAHSDTSASDHPLENVRPGGFGVEWAFVSTPLSTLTVVVTLSEGWQCAVLAFRPLRKALRQRS